jgi:hypothetical protein
MTDLDDENLIKRFLLGELSPDEHERVGERLLGDEDFFAQVDAIEEDLIDDFACGRLGAAESERFERHFLVTDERRERLRFAFDFHQVLSASQPPAAQEAAVSLDDNHPGWWAWLRGRRALAFGSAFALLLIASGAVLLWRVLGRRTPQERVAATQEQRNMTSQNENVRVAGNDNRDETASGNQGQGETSPPPPRVAPSATTNEAPRRAENRGGNRPAAASLLAVALEPGSLRAEGGVKKFPVPKGVKTVLLKLQFDEDEEGATQQGESYSAEVKNSEIKTVHQAENLRASPARDGRRFVTVSVPARLLPVGNYQAVLRLRTPNGQLEGVGNYYFNVTEARSPKGGN